MSISGDSMCIPFCFSTLLCVLGVYFVTQKRSDRAGGLGCLFFLPFTIQLLMIAILGLKFSLSGPGKYPAAVIWFYIVDIVVASLIVFWAVKVNEDEPLFGWLIPSNIAKMKATGDAKGLIKAIRFSPNSRVRENAADALTEIGKPAVEPLIALLQERRYECDVADALGNISDERAVEPLIERLKKGFNVAAVARALGKIGDKRAVEPLIAILQKGMSNDNYDVARALGKIGDKRAVKPLIAALQDGRYSSIHKVVAEALGEIGDKRAVKPLISALQRAHVTQKQAFIEALEQIGDDRAIEPLHQASAMLKKDQLINALKDPVFKWDLLTNMYWGSNETRMKELRQESHRAITWFDAQDFVPIPSSTIDEIAAEYYFKMSSLARDSGNVQEAWAGYHKALQLFCRMNNEMKIGVTCFNLGQVYVIQENWQMANMMFQQSAYIANSTGERKNYAWALFWLGDTYKQLGDKDSAIIYVTEALRIFQQVAPEEVSGVQQALRRLSDR